MKILKLVLMMKIIMVGNIMVLVEDKFLSLMEKIIDVAPKTSFFGLTGGGCCDKDKVFIGLVPCKEDEKKLAKLNK